ncbi:MAG TPA: ArsA-related P-loop ATPase [Solirubrobacteraceae bacterium]|nr:ArsA-related P-loop ATPase [Solirubrobacteraceae bacterium]
MASLLERKLIVVTGKGGAGKSTIAAALGLLGARSGLRTIVVEVGEQDQLRRFYEDPAPQSSPQDGTTLLRDRAPGIEMELEPNLWSLSLDPDLDLIEWMRDLGGRLPARLLASSSSFQYLAAAAPGAKELVSLVKLHELSAAGKGRYDLVVFDAPATGHALAMLASPRTLLAIVRSSPLAQRAADVQEMLEDRLHTGYVAVTRATEMAMGETLELEEGVRRVLERNFDAVLVNGTLSGRFTRAELARIASATETNRSSRSAEDLELLRSAGTLARVVSDRHRQQQSQISRLRHRDPATGTSRAVWTVPYIFKPELDLEAVETIAKRIGRRA